MRYKNDLSIYTLAQQLGPIEEYISTLSEFSEISENEVEFLFSPDNPDNRQLLPELSEHEVEISSFLIETFLTSLGFPSKRRLLRVAT